MNGVATLRYAIVSPKKVWRISKELRGMTYADAINVLREINAKPARFLEKLMKSAFYSLINKDPNLSEDEAVIESIHIAKGPFYKRMMPRARGRADIIKKRTSHIKVVIVKKEAK
ncbi:MAG TPA: 50S ribosomal protein L22 [Spirochaetota bacterium]|nr:50S ribosomal protein L22 [Spirochaetota bacterium]HOM37919.1 50S ribosomal protein L22 [Spirochaetota bacterium]HPQ48723.1 50S ribosomal protein L22 [Spirochaetota bacterium]